MPTQKFEQVQVTCTNNDKTVLADVLQKNDKLLKIAFVGSNMPIMLYKNNEKKIYIGEYKNLEFISKGESL